MKSCRTCKYLDVEPNKAGRIVARKGSGYRCLAPDAPLPVLPDSITKGYGFCWPLRSRRYMLPDEGTECPVWEARAEKQEVA